MGLRITDQGLANARIGWISAGRTKLAEQERAISSGVQLEQPSDDPAAAAQLMRHDIRLQRITQYQRNANNAKLWVASADSALLAVSNNLNRAKTLGVQAGNDILGGVENAALAADIRAVAAEIRTSANTKVSGRAIFAGTADTPDAYDTADTYMGDAGVVELTIDTGESVVIGSSGPDVFGVSNGGDPMNGSVFEVLNALADAVEIGDTAAVRTGLEAIDIAATRIGEAQGRVGAISQQLDAAGVRHSGERMAVQSTVSKIRDTDVAEAIIRLRSAEAGYEATLAATARGISSSLLDFLR
ncbi:MAG: flagellar hook-associated protein FlgL [Acidimicrobiales bacterium]